MAFIAPALPYITAGATIASSVGQADAEQQMAEIQAAQLRKQSIASEAEAVQTAKHERRKAKLLQSRVIALSASSGSAVSSLDIQNTLSDIDERGEYNALAALYSGTTAAGSKRYQADVASASGKQAKASGYGKAGATILDFSAEKYG